MGFGGGWGVIKQMFTNAVRKKEGVNDLFLKVNFFQARWQSHESTANVYILAMNVSIIFA